MEGSGVRLVPWALLLCQLHKQSVLHLGKNTCMEMKKLAFGNHGKHVEMRVFEDIENDVDMYVTLLYLSTNTAWDRY